MFICENCVPTISKLSDLGRDKWERFKSLGPCEKCDEEAECGEVSAQIDAYWDDNIPWILEKMGL